MPSNRTVAELYRMTLAELREYAERTPDGYARQMIYTREHRPNGWLLRPATPEEIAAQDAEILAAREKERADA